ncbi:MAG TPA: glycoside hydrolase family 28 protein [Mucilaginibacter sp.]|nr:glycoside hydrolase family 28 protein [Mucilaginibacter sp.]
MKRTTFTLLVLLMSASVIAQTKSSVYNVKTFGAVGDGKNLDSKAINKAIDSAAGAGGGTVYLPAGNYLSGSIHLKSNISLYIDQGATIIASDEDVYDHAEQTVNTTYQDYGHSHFHNSLIWGEDVHDVSILGPGTIYGKGLLRDYKKDSPIADKALTLHKCRNIIIRDVTFAHGGWFAILATGVDNLTIDNLKMDTNRDGMDIDCCRNVHVSNCSVNSPYDDGICLKSTFALGFARATENVTITNCQVSGYDEGSFLDGTYKRTSQPEYGLHPTGRIKFNTESNGGFKNVVISNCTFDYCRGMALETVDGALLEDVSISNITMRDITNSPIFMRLGARMRGPQGTPVGELRRVTISNVRVYNADAEYGCQITGIPGHDIKEIELNNIRIYYKGGGKANDKPVPEQEKNYPEPGMFGAMPAYGFYIRHVSGIKLRDVEVTYIDEDTRPAFVLDDVKAADIHNIKGQTAGVEEIKRVNGKQ